MSLAYERVRFLTQIMMQMSRSQSGAMFKPRAKWDMLCSRLAAAKFFRNVLILKAWWHLASKKMQAVLHVSTSSA